MVELNELLSNNYFIVAVAVVLALVLNKLGGVLFGDKNSQVDYSSYLALAFITAITSSSVIYLIKYAEPMDDSVFTSKPPF